MYLSPLDKNNSLSFVLQTARLATSEHTLQCNFIQGNSSICKHT